MDNTLLGIGDAVYFVASVYLPDNTKNKEAGEVAEQLHEHTTAEIFEVVCFGFLGIKPRKGQDLQRLWSNHEKLLPGEEFHPIDSGSNSHSDAESIEEPTSLHDVPDVACSGLSGDCSRLLDNFRSFA